MFSGAFCQTPVLSSETMLMQVISVVACFIVAFTSAQSTVDEDDIDLHLIYQDMKDRLTQLQTDINRLTIPDRNKDTSTCSYPLDRLQNIQADINQLKDAVISRNFL